MTLKSPKAKGSRHERAVAETFRAVVATAKRGLSQARGGGAESPDVVIPVLHLECKHRKQQDIFEALNQAEEDAKPGKTPAAVIRVDRMPDVIVFKLAKFVPLFGEFLKWKEEQEKEFILCVPCKGDGFVPIPSPRRGDELCTVCNGKGKVPNPLSVARATNL
jgi:hypothetical protein